MHSKTAPQNFFLTGLSAIIISLLLIVSNGCRRDTCQDIICLNGGDCIDGSCDCPDGYSGADCGTPVSVNYFGTYNVTESCPDLVSYTVNVSADTTNINKVNIANFFNSFSNLVSATINYTNINISLQAPDNDGRTITGTGTFIPPDQIDWNYTISDASGTINCSGSVWQK